MTRVAAIDCGTNTIKLLVADLDPATGTEVEHSRLMRMVRLGQGVDRTGRLADEALARTFAAIEEYAEAIDAHAVEAIRFCATSATRDAANADVFARGVKERLGVYPDVVTGDEEAQLSYDGATRTLLGRSGEGGDLPGPILVIDIGGGSTELILGDASEGATPAVHGSRGHIRAARSLDVGSVRMTERHLHSDPPTVQQVTAAEADVAAALDVAAEAVPLAKARTLVGLAGSVTTVTAHALRLDSYRPERIHGSVLPVEDVVSSCTDLLTMTREQRAALPYMHPGRVDVIGAGALVWRCVVQRVAAEAGLLEVVTSEHDILDGIALSIA